MDIEIKEFQENEIEERNNSNNMVQFIQASLEDNTSDEEGTSGSDSDNEDIPFESLWPVFTMINSCNDSFWLLGKSFNPERLAIESPLKTQT